MPYANDLDIAGKNSRQRKTRLIRVDSREHDAVTSTLLKGMGYTVEQLGMPVGDYGWDVKVGSLIYDRGYRYVALERKTLSDLRDVARLRKQLSRMRATTLTFCILLIEHAFDTDRKRRWPEESILNAELSIQLGGVMVTRCDGNDVAGRIHSLYTWSQKKTHQLAGGD